MAFVYEEVGEENRGLWDSIGWKDWGERTPVIFRDTRKWCIDKERNIFMLPIGCFIDTPYYYDLAFDGRIVRMVWIAGGGGGNLKDGFDLVWKIGRIYIPKSLWSERENVLQAIKEAFGVYRGGHKIEKVKSISVEICYEPECVEADYNGK